LRKEIKRMKTIRCDITLVLAAAVLAASIPCFGQEERAEISELCFPGGTWWGGSEGFKYLLTIVPIRAGLYSVNFQAAYSVEGLGFPVETEWNGEMKRKRHGYKIWAISLVNTDAGFPPGQLPIIQAVRGTIEFDDCDTLTLTWNFFKVYFWGHVPFVDPPDAPGPPTPILETYSRMPRE
jgi:hypothetical protein